MSKYDLQCRIRALDEEISSCKDKIEENNRKIADLEAACNAVASEKPKTEESLYEKNSSFSTLEGAKSKKISALGSHLKSVCSEQRIAEVLCNYEGIISRIKQKIEEFEEENRRLREKIERCENEIDSCRSQISAIEREERESRERAERENREKEAGKCRT